MLSPAMRPVTVMVIWLPVETALTSAAVAYCPTTHTSTAPYIACITSESSTGPVKASSALSMLPWVKLYSRAIVSSLPESKKAG